MFNKESQEPAPKASETESVPTASEASGGELVAPITEASADSIQQARQFSEAGQLKLIELGIQGEALAEDKRLAFLQEKNRLANEQEKKRGWLATSLVGILAASLVSFTVLIGTDHVNDSNRELLTIFWTSQIGLVSSAIGYYFGSGSKDTNADRDR